jgi:hypothetical protein
MAEILGTDLVGNGRASVIRLRIPADIEAGRLLFNAKRSGA